jgi:hypothetical protein
MLITDAKTRKETCMDKQTYGEARCWIYQDARLSAQQRNQQASEVERRMIALHLERGVDPMVLGAARAEYEARAQLAAQAERNRAAARSRVLEQASDNDQASQDDR